MQRVTITLDDELLQAIDRIMVERGYQNRSEAIRDLARAGLAQAADDAAPPDASSVGALVYVYDHESRDLSKRLVHTFHDHHDLTLATMHVHLDHESCMEVTVLRGPTSAIRHVGEHVIAERGVRHGRLVLVPVAVEPETHGHGAEPGHRHDHIHVRHGG